MCFRQHHSTHRWEESHRRLQLQAHVQRDSHDRRLAAWPSPSPEEFKAFLKAGGRGPQS